MCWVLYLAADGVLPLRPFDPEAPAFNVAGLDEHDLPVRSRFGKRFVYRVGSQTLCGCGFDRDQANPDHPDELPATVASLGALREYLQEAVRTAGPLELYACWDGDQTAEPDHHLRLTPADFTPEMSWFPDRTFAQVEVG